MSVAWHWACKEKGEYVLSDGVGDNPRLPIDEAAHAVFLLLNSGRWSSARVYSDLAGLPWEEVGGWVDVTTLALDLLDDDGAIVIRGSRVSVYTVTRISDERPR